MLTDHNPKINDHSTHNALFYHCCASVQAVALQSQHCVKLEMLMLEKVPYFSFESFNNYLQISFTIGTKTSIDILVY